MKKITKDELDVFLRKHKLWLQNDSEGERAYLRDADLRGAHLGNADLRGADLRGVNLSNAYLRDADLRGADLLGADLSNADLRGADLLGADLSNADLRGAYLCGANLSNAYLYGADLSSAYLYGADLSSAYLCGAKNIFCPINCPEEGEFIGFKKAGRYIVKLKITDDAKRCSSTERKCRCSKALVLSIETIDGKNDGTMKVPSNYDSKFVYRVGQPVEVENFCDDRWKECSEGIHFFITRKEAEDY